MSQAATALEPKASWLSLSELSSAQQLFQSLLLCVSREQLRRLQQQSLVDGAYLFHLARSLGSAPTARRSQDLVASLSLECAASLRTLGRVFPASLTRRLSVEGGPLRLGEGSFKEPLVESGGDTRCWDAMALKTVFLPARANWRGFWEALGQTSEGYNCIWDGEMRQQAEKALAEEWEEFHQQGGSWDFEGFRVEYPRLQELVCVDGYYLQKMVEFCQQGSALTVQNPPEFVHHLVDLFVVSRDLAERQTLFFLLERVLRGNAEAVASFPSMRYLCFLLEDPRLEASLVDQALQILDLCCAAQPNAEEFQAFGGVDTLSRLLANAVFALSRDAQADRLSLDSTQTPHTAQAAHTERCRRVLQVLRSAEQSRRRLRAALLAEPVLSRLLRAMLIEDPESHVLLLAMLDSALTSATRTQATVYRSGLFPVLLLRAASTRMTEEEARLLAEYHLRQEAGEVQHCFSDAADKSDLSALLETAGADVEKRVSIARRFSYLRFFLPSSLIALLTREGPTRFCEVFNAERVEEPEVLWSTELREHLARELQAQLGDYVRRISVDPTEEWEYVTPSVIQFAPIDDKLCVCNVFLEAFLLEEASLPATVEPVAFLSELTSELDLRLNVICKMKTTPDEFTYKDTTMLLQSMLKLLLTKKEVSKVDKKVFTVLGRCLSVSLDLPSNLTMANNALEVIVEALLPRSFGKPSSVNMCECSDAGCIASFDHVLNDCLTDALFNQLATPTSETYQVFHRCLKCITLLAGKTTTRGVESLVTHPQFVHTLIQFIFVDSVELCPTAGLEVLQAFEQFLQNEKLLEIAVNSGLLIYLTMIALCLQKKTETDGLIIDNAVTCLELLAGVGNENAVPSTVVEAMTQLLTPGLMKALRDHTFLSKMRCANIRHPLLVWNLDMANTLSDVLANEDESIARNESSGTGYWNMQAFHKRDGYLEVYPNLRNEYIVDEVFLGPFLEQPDVELTDPTPEHFLKALMEFVVHLQSAQDLVRSAAKDASNVKERLLVALRSMAALLSCHVTLQPTFVNDSNIHRLFSLLRDTTIGWDLQSVLLSLLDVAVSTQSGCDILSSFVPSLRLLLQSNCSRTYLPVLRILEQLAEHNDQVVQVILSSGTILMLLDMILFFQNEYDGDVQDMAIVLLGKLMKNFKYGDEVRKYVVALFTPLFRGENEKSGVLANCDTDPGELREVLSSDIYTPTVFWNARVREDLKTFLQSEVRTMRTSDQEYEYHDVEVAKRMKASRVTLNAQLVVADIFVKQYIASPFCELDRPRFLNGLLENLRNRLPGVKSSDRHDEEFVMLMRALKLFILDCSEQEKPLDDALCTSTVSFLMEFLRDNVQQAQDTAISVLESVAQQAMGLKEFERNNTAVEESSYMADLLVATSVLGNQSGSAYRVTEVVKHLVTASAALRETCYHAGAIVYGLSAVLSNFMDMESPYCMGRVYLEVIRELVTYVPKAEEDILACTTSRFKERFRKDPSLVDLFIRQEHEAFSDDNTVRVWSADVRKALCDVLEKMVKKMNADSNSAGWDRVSNRFVLDEVTRMWRAFTKNKQTRQREDESRAIKVRSTIAGTSRVDNGPIRGSYMSDGYSHGAGSVV